MISKDNNQVLKKNENYEVQLKLKEVKNSVNEVQSQIDALDPSDMNC
jgi:hypothetical protein